VRFRIVVLAVFLSLAAAPAAGEAQTGAGDSQKGLGFGIRALGPDGTRGYFFYRDAEPGGRLRSRIRIGNITSRPKTVVLRAQDTTSSGSGGLSYGPVKDGPGTWVSPRSRRVTVPARSSVDVGFEVRIPRESKAGDHFAGIVAYDADDLARLRTQSKSEQSVQLKFISRLAIPIRIRLPGDLVAKVVVRDVKLNVSPSNSSVDVIFANVGNVLIPTSEGQVQVSQGDLVLGTRRIDLTSFTPGSQLRVAVAFRGAPAEATYRAKGFLQPLFAPAVNFDETVTFGGAQAVEFKRETGITAIGADKGGVPVWMWIAGAIALLLAAALLARNLKGKATQAPAALDPTLPVPVYTSASPQPAATAPAASSNPPLAGVLSIDINTASAEELTRLPGVGPSAARRIIEHRLEYGSFASVEDLTRVEGFDSDRVATLAQRATAGPL